jgi:uncharacterized membrane protein YbhN (UPF0104 family)
MSGERTAPRAAAASRVGSALRRAAPWLLAAVVLALVARQARGIDWGRVLTALREQPPAGIAGALGIAFTSYAVFASYDLVGRRELRHGVPVVRTLRIAAICYAVNLNFGSLVGALALKLRLYGRAGLKPGTVMRLIALALATNWLGYALVAGAVLALAPPPLPPDWPVGAGTLRAVGVALLAGGIAYVVGCWRTPRRTLAFRGHAFTLPDGAMALWQAVVASAHWLLVAAIPWLLLQRAVDYPTVLAVLLLGAVAGVVTHVPAGLGVLEAVFVGCLGHRVPATTLLAALLAYRATYYLAPLVVALGAYAATELRRGKPA